MGEHSKYSLPVETNRSYMKAIRSLLGFGQYHAVRLLKSKYIIRESEVSAIEGKIGYSDHWLAYAACISVAIEDSGHKESVKEVMRTLLKEWEDAKR